MVVTIFFFDVPSFFKIGGGNKQTGCVTLFRSVLTHAVALILSGRHDFFFPSFSKVKEVTNIRVVSLCSVPTHAVTTQWHSVFHGRHHFFFISIILQMGRRGNKQTGRVSPIPLSRLLTGRTLPVALVPPVRWENLACARGPGSRFQRTLV